MPGKDRDDEICRDVKQLLHVYAPYAQETEGNISTIRREMADTKINQVELLRLFLLLWSHSYRNYPKLNKEKKNVEKDEQSFSELWTSISSLKCVIGDLQDKKRRTDNYLDKIIRAQYFPNLMKTRNPQIKSTMNYKHIECKLNHTKVHHGKVTEYQWEKEKKLKAVRGKRHSSFFLLWGWGMHSRGEAGAQFSPRDGLR